MARIVAQHQLFGPWRYNTPGGARLSFSERDLQVHKAAPKTEHAAADESQEIEKNEEESEEDEEDEEDDDDYYDRYKDIIRLHPHHLTAEDIETLVGYAKPAPYGDLKQGRTNYDPSVRTALELPLSCMVLSSAEMGLIQSLVGKHLIPDSKFCFKPYKLNIYREGDFFKPHVDTPRSSEMIGTLVIALPVAHGGGDLIIRHHGHETTFSSAQTANEDTCASLNYFCWVSLMQRFSYQAHRQMGRVL